MSNCARVLLACSLLALVVPLGSCGTGGDEGVLPDGSTVITVVNDSPTFSYGGDTIVGIRVFDHYENVLYEFNQFSVTPVFLGPGQGGSLTVPGNNLYTVDCDYSAGGGWHGRFPNSGEIGPDATEGTVTFWRDY